MPRSYTKVTKKAEWTSAQLNQAVKLVEDGSSIRAASKVMKIPFSTLQERIKNKNYVDPCLGRHPVFSREVEHEMAKEIKYLANIFYGCTTIQIRKMAYQYAEIHNIKNNFNTDSKMAGPDWLAGFLERNHISVRKPEATSVNRITAFNKTEVTSFYKLLEEVMVKYNFVPNNIYNCNETGISTVQEPGKIVAEKGQKRVGSITSWERGRNITALCAMNPTGGYIPPMFIYPRKRMTPLLEKDGPIGSIYKCSDNGWINEGLFREWLQHFASYAKPSKDAPILLILDNHSSHISLPIFEYCKTNHIVMLSLPPHSSHRMQPLDLTFFGPLKAAYKNECDLFMKSRLAEKITPYEVASLFQKAFSRVASISKAESGFRAAGIFPLNPNHFTEEDFIPAEVLLSEPVVVDSESLLDLSTTSTSQELEEVPSISTQLEEIASAPTQLNPIPGTSSNLDAIPSKSRADIALNSQEDTASSKTLTRVRDLLSMPTKSSPVNTRKGRPKQHAQILTSTPNKEELEVKENKKIAKKQKEKCKDKGKGKVKKAKIQKKGVEKVKRQVFREKNETSDESDVNSAELCDDSEDDDMKDDRNRCITDDMKDDPSRCIICDEFGQDNEMWYRCTSCGLWAHSECSGWDSADGYLCENCFMH